MTVKYNIFFKSLSNKSFGKSDGVLVVGRKDHLVKVKDAIEKIRSSVTKQDQDEAIFICFLFKLFKAWSHKIVKHSQTICQQ